MSERLFVYGTLAPTRANEHVLSPLKGTWEKATVKGKLKHAGWGASMGYPGFIYDEKGDKIEGFLFTSSDLKDFWTTLDAFEGEEYTRIIVPAICENGAKVEAYIYAIKENS